MHEESGRFTISTPQQVPFQLSLGVEEILLENGLKVLLKPVQNSSAVSTWVFYKVGSRNERPGITGASHWCEHMLFKGGGKLGKGDVHTLVGREGGRNNAFTDQDLTAYFETLPREKLETALFIESERMTNSAFDPHEVESERQVIISEREGSENYPSYQVREEVFATAFRVHPYRWPVIGWKSDLKTMTRDDLFQHYHEFYTPDNAILVICGNFELTDGKRLASEYFAKNSSRLNGDIAMRESPRQEPAQNGERTSRLIRPGTLDYLGVGFHLPSYRDVDLPSLMVLATILGGWKGLVGFSADRFIPRSNRLYKKLVAGKLASEVNTYFPLNIDPGLLYFDVTALPGIDLYKVRDAMFSLFESIMDSPPEEKEMTVAFNQIKSWYAYENDGITFQAQSLGLFETLGRRTLGDELVTSSLSVTPDQVYQVARKYLSESKRSVCAYESKVGVGR